MPDLLWEIGTEEIPAGYLADALLSLKLAFDSGCSERGLEFQSIRAAATPRRLALFAEGLPATQPSRTAEMKGPPARAAFGADGAPMRAAEAFAEKCGVAVAALEVRDTDKGPYVFAQKREGGASVASLLPDICRAALAGVATPKSMHWGVAGVRFARPIRSMCLLLDGEVIDCELAGVRTGRVVHGHPFLAPGPIELARADWDAYRAALERAKVVLEFDERVRRIAGEVKNLGADPAALSALVNEVANLTEWPTALVAEFDATFLSVPAPVLVAAMTHHQRYFPIYDGGALTNRFAVVTNRLPEHHATIRAGNERVLRARLADARFFFEADRRQALSAFADKLRDVGAHEQLGTLWDRADRLRRVAESLSSNPKAPAAVRGCPAEHIARAARLCKADLPTQMVGEFPELQGVVGEIYARLDGEPGDVPAAIHEHYLPKGTDSPLPQTSLGLLVAVADRAGTIMEAFALGREPTGDRDQYGVRRAAYGLLELMVRGLGAGRVSGLLWLAADALPRPLRETALGRLAAAQAFVTERLQNWARDARDPTQPGAGEGFAYDTVRACAATGTDDPVDFFARCRAVHALRAAEGWADLVEVVDRTRRILAGASIDGPVSPALLREPAEQALAEALRAAAGDVGARFKAADWVAGAASYRAALARPVHEFFDRVFVNADDAALRRNRLALLRDVNRLFTAHLADLSQIEGAGTPAAESAA